MDPGSLETCTVLRPLQAPSVSVRLRQAPSVSVRLRRAPSGFEGPRTSAHTHPQSTLHRPSRIATLVRTALGLVVRCGMTMPYYEGPLPFYMPTMVEVGWADGMQAHTLLWHRPCWSVLGQATIMCTALYCHGMKPGPSESSLPPSDGASPLPSDGASLPPSSSSKTTARRLGGGSSGRRSCAAVSGAPLPPPAPPLLLRFKAFHNARTFLRGFAGSPLDLFSSKLRGISHPRNSCLCSLWTVGHQMSKSVSHKSPELLRNP